MRPATNEADEELQRVIAMSRKTAFQPSHQTNSQPYY